MNKTIVAAAALALGALAAPAQALTTIELTNITATFFGGEYTNGDPITDYAGGGTADAQVRFGRDRGFGLSGYNFLSAGSVGTTVVVPGSSDPVTLGDFQHVNVPIRLPSASFVNLRLTSNVVVDGADLGVRSFVFRLNHNETNNFQQPCPFGGDNRQGINVNGCADRVTADFSNASETFVVGGYTYTLNVLGFLQDGALVDGFTTVEERTNTAQLIGSVTVLQNVVPEPATWAMMIAGFGLVGFAARRRGIAVVAS